MWLLGNCVAPVVAPAILSLFVLAATAQSTQLNSNLSANTDGSSSEDARSHSPEIETGVSQNLDEKALTEVVETIRSDHEKIGQFYVRFETEVVESLDAPGEPSYVYQWAMSGEKRYLRRDLTPADSRRRLPWRLAIWDGMTLKEYDSTAQTGTVYLSNYPQGQSPLERTACVYSQMFGHPDRGTLPELFDRVPISGWQGEWVEEGKILRLSSDRVHPGDRFRYSWTIDLTKGSCVTSYEWLVKDQDGAFYLFEKDTVEELYELLPGVWSARAITVETRDENGIYLGGSKATATDFRVNEDVADSLFQFEFPAGSEYQDRSKGTFVPVGQKPPGVVETILDWLGLR